SMLMFPCQLFLQACHMGGGERDDDVSRPRPMDGMPGFRCLLVGAHRQRTAVFEVIPGLELLGCRHSFPIADEVEWGTAGGRFGGFLPDPHRGREGYLTDLRALRRSSGLRSRLRIRRLFGVTSTSSSGPIYSSANSKPISRGGVRTSASSVPDARMLDRCFSLQTLTSMSSSRLFSPTTIPR